MAHIPAFRIRQSDEIPEVELCSVYDRQGRVIERYKAVTEKNTGRVLAINSAVYQPVQHRDIYNFLKKVSQRYGIEKEYAYVYGGGAKFTMECYSHLYTVEVKKDDIVQAGYKIVNSYDCRHALTVYSIALRLACMNGMLVPAFREKIYRGIHIYEVIRIDELERILEKALAQLGAVLQLLRKSTAVKVADVNAVYKKLKIPNRYKELAKLEVEGDTIWDVYNALTKVITHQAAPNVSPERRTEFQKEANKVLELVYEEPKEQAVTR